MSGEMKATAMLGKVNELIDSQMSFLNKTQQRDIYRSLGALGALLPKGGDAVWGGDVVTVRSRNRSVCVGSSTSSSCSISCSA